MDTITVRPSYHVQNELKTANRQLDYYHNNNVAKFKFEKFEYKFNNPYNTSITILKSDLDKHKTFFEESKADLHQLRVKIYWGQTYDPITYLYLLRWNKIVDKTIDLIG